MKNLPAPHVDSGAICALAFYVNRSRNYNMAKKYAGWFKNNYMTKLGGRNVHVVVVQKEMGESLLAMGLIDIIKEWRNARIFGPDGTILNAWRLRDILSCYAESFRTENPATYCRITSTDNQFPCRQATFPPRWIKGQGSLEEYLDWVTEVHAPLCPIFTFVNELPKLK